MISEQVAGIIFDACGGQCVSLSVCVLVRRTNPHVPNQCHAPFPILTYSIPNSMHSDS